MRSQRKKENNSKPFNCKYWAVQNTRIRTQSMIKCNQGIVCTKNSINCKVFNDARRPVLAEYFSLFIEAELWGRNNFLYVQVFGLV